MKSFNLSFVALLAIPLSGCISLFPEQGPPPQEIFLQSSLNQGASFETHAKPKHVLSIGDPQAPAYLRLKTIALSRLEGGARVLDHVAGTQWHGAPMALLQREMLNHSIGLGVFKGVVNDGSPVAADLRLETFVDDLSVDLTKNPAVARLRITALFWDNKSQGLLRQKAFHFETPIKAQTPMDIQESFKDLLDQYLKALGEWMVG